MHRSEIPIVTPCSLAREWEALEGDAKKRFCGQCSRHVHDLSAISEPEARELVTTEHVCVRYTVDAAGRILHWPALAVGALLATTAQAAPAIEATNEPGWLPWLAEKAQTWWYGSPPAPAVQLPVILEPLMVTAGVPAPPPWVSVEDKTRTAQWLESSCCGRAPFVEGRATISVEGEGYIELVGHPSTRLRVHDGDYVVCEAIDGVISCR